MDKNDREEFDILTRRVNRLEQSDAEQNAALDRLIFPRATRDPEGTLPPESDAVQAARVSAHNLTRAQVDAAREARGMTGAHDLSPKTMAISISEFELATRATRERASLYAGIRDVYEMLDRERPADPGSIVHAALARLAAILDKA